MANQRIIRQAAKLIRLGVVILVAAIFVTGCKYATSDGARGESLLEARDQAVLAGLQWMAEFLEDEKNFRDIGLDAVYIFLELSVTSANPAIREEATRIAHKFALRLQKHYLELDGRMPESKYDSKKDVELLDLLSEAKLLGLDPRPLEARAETVFNNKNSSISEDFKKEMTLDELEKLLEKSSEAEVFYILLDAYSIEKANVIYPGRFPVKVQLPDILKYLKNRRLVSYSEDKSKGKELFYDHAFLATHIAYISSNYGRLKLHRQDAPWVYAYLRSNFYAALAEEDVELVGEFIDVFRSLGFSEENDAMVRSGTLMLLSSQNPDGSWCKWQEYESPYDAIHCAWCAVMGLRERTFLEDTPYHRRIREILSQVNRESM